MKKKLALPPVHPAAEFFALHEGEPLQKLAQDIREIGQQEPITFLGDLLLDGRRRWLACQIAGVEPMVEQYSAAADPVAWVWSKNYHRRHSGSADRSMEAARYLIYRQQHGADADMPPPPEASRTSTTRARKVLRDGAPEVVAAVDAGVVAVSDAARIVEKPKPEQRKALEEVVAGKSRTLAEAAQVKPIKAGESFNEKTLDDLYGKLLRATIQRHKVNGEKKSKSYDTARDALRDFADAIHDWRKEK